MSTKVKRLLSLAVATFIVMAVLGIEGQVDSYVWPVIWIGLAAPVLLGGPVLLVAEICAFILGTATLVVFDHWSGLGFLALFFLPSIVIGGLTLIFKFILEDL